MSMAPVILVTHRQMHCNYKAPDADLPIPGQRPHRRDAVDSAFASVVNGTTRYSHNDSIIALSSTSDLIDDFVDILIPEPSCHVQGSDGHDKRWRFTLPDASENQSYINCSGTPPHYFHPHWV